MTTSIVIPCYQHGRYLADAIRSALWQTCPPVEIVVVDDGSSDNTQEVAREFLHHGVKYVWQENRGLPAARNAGVRRCVGEYVVFLDADDQLDPSYVEVTARILGASSLRVGYVYTQCLLFGSDQGITEYPSWDVERLMHSNFVHASALLRRDVVLKYPYNEALRNGSEDWDFYLTLAERGIEGVLLNEPLLRYRRHGGSSMLDHLRSDRARTVRFQQSIRRSHWRIWGLREQLRSEVRFAVLYCRLRGAGLRRILRTVAR